MDFSNLIYYIKSGIDDVRHNSAMSISSIIIVIAGMCVFGVYSILSANVEYISNQLFRQYSITAYIEKGVPEERMLEIKEEILKINGTSEVEYISEAQALEECREMFGEHADFLEGLESNNPLRASMVITMHDLNDSDRISEETSKITDIAWVKNDGELADKLVSSTAAIRRASLILMIVFLIIALFIISNTIKITIFARSSDIYTMRYLGATGSFIIIPFVVEGIIIGLVGALIAYILAMAGYGYVSSAVSDFLGEALTLYSTGSICVKSIGSFLGLGIVLGGLSSVFPLVKYMKA